MNTSANAQVIPENLKGKALDIEETITENTVEEAINTYNRACARLLNPPIWHELAGMASASFKIAADNKDQLHRLLQLNDHIMIDIPGPGPSAGDGYDWVIAELIKENFDPSAKDSLAVRLKASAQPGKTDEGIAHFFDKDATSTFIIKRDHKIVSVSYHGRNEIPNVEEVGTADKIRNSIVASGAILGLSEVQWKALLRGFLQKEIGGHNN